MQNLHLSLLKLTLTETSKSVHVYLLHGSSRIDFQVYRIKIWKENKNFKSLKLYLLSWGVNVLIDTQHYLMICRYFIKDKIISTINKTFKAQINEYFQFNWLSHISMISDSNAE